MLSKKLHEALNAQINAEMWSAYLYLSMSLDAEVKGYKGIANWFYVQFREEQDHARIFMNYLLSRDAAVSLQPIEAVRTSWASPLEMFRDTLEHEQVVTGMINNLAAIARELTRWRENGVETGEDAERYLRQAKQREAWCAEAAAQFGIEPAALTRWERGAIARWHEEWGVGREMIDEALLRAGSKNTVRYVDGILRAWRAQGITTVEAARGQGQLAGSNILATERPAAPRPAASAQKDLFNRDWAAQFNEED